MCDYSLAAVKSRPARIADQLEVTGFKNTLTRGLAAVDEPNVAVCLRPGTEVAFKATVIYNFGPLGLFCWRTASPLARFRQINTDDPHVHHDALEFSDGRIISLQNIAIGQRATVLQLPADGDVQRAPFEEARSAAEPAPSLAAQC